MPFVEIEDDFDIFYKDFSPKEARPIALHHGLPPSSRDRVLIVLRQGFEAVTSDRSAHAAVAGATSPSRSAALHRVAP